MQDWVVELPSSVSRRPHEDGWSIGAGLGGRRMVDASERIGSVLSSPPADHLSAWLGGGPPALPVRVVQDPEHEQPGCDGTARGVAGVVAPEGRCVVRLPPAVAARSEVPLPDVGSLLAALPAAVGVPGTAGAGVLRWAQDVPDRDVLPDIGIWLPACLAVDGDPRVPAWLRPFGAPVL